MVSAKSTKSVGNYIDLAKAIIEFKEEKCGDRLHSQLIKLAYEALLREGYNLKTLSQQQKEEHISNLVFLGISKIQSKIELPEGRDFDSLREFNKRVFNFILTCMTYKLKQDYRHEKRRKVLLNKTSKPVVLNPLNQESNQVFGSDFEAVLCDLNPLDKSVAVLLAQQYNKTDISKKLGVSTKKIQSSIRRLKSALSDNNIL